MREFGMIPIGFWRDSAVASLPERAKLTAAYLLSGPHMNTLGCAPIPVGYVSADLHLPSERVEQRLGQLEAERFLTRHEDWILVHKALHWLKIRGPKQEVAGAKIFAHVPIGPMKVALAREIQAYAPALALRLKAEIELALGAVNDVSTQYAYPIDRISIPYRYKEKEKENEEPSQEGTVGPREVGAPTGAVVSLPIGRMPR